MGGCARSSRAAQVAATDTPLAGLSSPPASDQLDRIEQKLVQLIDLAKMRLADWLSIENAAIVCDCSYDHISRAVERGELPASDIGNGEKKAAYRIARSDLNVWMERNKGGKHLPPRSELEDKKSRYLPGVP
jgi:excisionase family DNA binding protein